MVNRWAAPGDLAALPAGRLVGHRQRRPRLRVSPLDDLRRYFVVPDLRRNTPPIGLWDPSSNGAEATNAGCARPGCGCLASTGRRTERLTAGWANVRARKVLAS